MSGRSRFELARARCCVCGGATQETTAYVYPMCGHHASEWLKQVSALHLAFDAAKLANASDAGRAFYRDWMGRWIAAQREGVAA